MRPPPKEYPLVTYKTFGEFTKIGVVHIVLNNGQRIEKNIRKIMMGVYDGDNKLHEVETVVIPKGKVI